MLTPYRSTTVYDSYGRVVAAINPLGNRTTSIFNSASQVLATIDGNGHRTSSVYDDLGRQIATIMSVGASKPATDGRFKTDRCMGGQFGF
jgi:YD repeat-containing protein